MCLRSSLWATSYRGSNTYKSFKNVKYFLNNSDSISDNSRRCVSSNDNDNSNKDDKLKIPEAPTNCCMSGCANCVWLEYAEKLTKLFKDSGETSRDIILSKVDDENMKAFLKMELAFLSKRLEQKNKDGDDQ